jgi:hypothetical protein
MSSAVTVFEVLAEGLESVGGLSFETESVWAKTFEKRKTTKTKLPKKVDCFFTTKIS